MSQPTGISAASSQKSGEIPRECRDELRELELRGIKAIVSLTERPLNAAVVRRHGFRYLHLPVPDMRPPTVQQIQEFVCFVEACKKERRGVVVHCLAGAGQTGTMLACYLVNKGYDAESAVRAVRLCRSDAIETESQLHFIERLAFELNQSQR